MGEKFICMVDDEIEIIKTVKEYFMARDFRVKGFVDGKDLFTFLEKERPDIIILDLEMPSMHGFDICKKLKKQKHFSNIPVIILSANEGDGDKVNGLDIGAEDYIVKPFSLRELDARVRVVLRRQTAEDEDGMIRIGETLVIDTNNFEVTVAGEKVELTQSEFKILECLCSKKGRVFSREKILYHLWGTEKIVVAKTVDVHIRHLREKLAEAGKFIKNIRGVGYKLEESF